jgi:hypothetical protein
MRLSRSVILIPIAVAMAACGSTSTSGTAPTPTPTPLPKADSICLSYDTSIGALTAPYTDVSSPANASELPGIATWLDKVLAQATQEQTALKAEPTAAPINALFATVITKLQAVDAAAKTNDLSTYKSAYTDYITANTAFTTAAKNAHLPDCG